ncbi:hypothetical protein, partial [Duodenibacillus massiliensis]|uniref:hypothetical protein n=1 Tax=Duodenibacillus massiliensis TaxID=1852381 RepID=UPI003A8EFDF1
MVEHVFGALLVEHVGSYAGEVLTEVSEIGKKPILRAYVWVVRPPILVNESLLTNTERAPGNRVAKYRARPQAARRYAA